MVNTLYSELMDSREGLALKQEESTASERIKCLEVELHRNSNRKIIERYANNGFLQDIIEGKTTFREAVQPILSRCKSLEEKIENTRGTVRITADIMYGIDAREKESVKESIQFLKQENLINPKDFLYGGKQGSSMVSIGARKLIDFGLRNLLAGVSIIMIPPTLIGGFMGYQFAETLAEKVLYSIVGGGGGFGPGSVVNAYVLGRLAIAQRTLQEQRQNFEQAIDFLDNEIREVYPINDYQI